MARAPAALIPPLGLTTQLVTPARAAACGAAGRQLHESMSKTKYILFWLCGEAVLEGGGPVRDAQGVIAIDRSSPVPLYFQVAQHFEAAIKSGALQAGERLENEVELDARLR